MSWPWKRRQKLDYEGAARAQEIARLNIEDLNRAVGVWGFMSDEVGAVLSRNATRWADLR